MYTAGISPAQVTGTPLLALWRSPAPFIVELHHIRAVSRVVADEIDIRVLVQVRVGVELSGDEVLDLAGTGSSDKGKSVNGRARVIAVGVRSCSGSLLSAANGKCKYQIKLVLGGRQFEQQRRRRIRVRVLLFHIVTDYHRHNYSHHHQQKPPPNNQPLEFSTHLHKLNQPLVTDLSPGDNLRARKSVRGDP